MFTRVIKYSNKQFVDPVIYKDENTTYKVFDHTIEGAWDSYNKPVRVIRSEEIKTVRHHSEELGKREYLKDT
ncbi:MAG: hypothetical protein FJW66_03615 [Actinobacteria bacterium]|nr:hypothetical protein [Actinomycetota bacterium]